MSFLPYGPWVLLVVMVVVYFILDRRRDAHRLPGLLDPRSRGGVLTGVVVSGEPANQQWAPPTDDQRIGAVDPYQDPFGATPDEIAPVDRQADPAHWLPGRALIIAAVVVGVALVATVVVCLIIWMTPPMQHLQVPSVPKG